MHNDPVYLKNLLALGDTHRLVTLQPLMTERGIKLVDCGVHLSSALHEKLARHRIAPPVDECITLEGALTVTDLQADLAMIIAGQPDFQALLGIDGEARLNAILQAFPLSTLAAFKLTLLKPQLPQVYRHSLEVAFFALLLAWRAGSDMLPEQAFASGLFHDLGLLHIDPQILLAPDVYGEPELKQIYTHPVIGHLILTRLKEWPACVGQAVLEHHERQDGSGYPKGVLAGAISPLGELLAVAELAAAIFSKRRERALVESVHVILRLNQGKLNRELGRGLLDMAMAIPAPAPAASGYACANLLDNLVALSSCILGWNALAGHLGHLPSVELINQRLAQLERNLAALGIDLQYWRMVDPKLHEDDAAVRELAIAAEEGCWQLKAIANEVMRKWDRLCPEHRQVQEEIWGWTRQVAGLVTSE